MAHIKLCIAAVTRPARHVLDRSGFTRADRSIRYGMRPHVLSLPQKAVRELTLHGKLQRVERAVAVIGLQAERTETSQRPLARGRVDAIHGVSVEQMMPGTADVADLRYKAVWKLLLQHEVPILVRQVLAVAGDRLWTQTLGLELADERRNRIRKIRYIR